MQCLQQCFISFALLNESGVLLEVSAKEQRQVLDELLLRVHAVRVGLLDVGVHGQHALQLLHRRREQGCEHFFIVGDAHGGDLGQALERDITKHGDVEKLEDERRDQLRLEDVAQRDPVEEPQQGLQGGADQGGVLRVVHHELAKLEHFAELRAHGVFQVFRLGLGHLAAREVEDLLAQEFEDDHVVLAERLVCLGRTHNVRDEALPILWPFTF